MKDHAIAYIGAGLISILLFTTVLGFVWNSKNKRNLNEERDRTEALDTENRMIADELDRLRKDYAALQIQNDSANQLITQRETDLSERDRRIASLSRSNADKTIKMREEIGQLQADNESLQANLSEMRQEHEELLSQNKELNAAIENLESQREDLASKFASSQIYEADNFIAYATRGKNRDKITAKARCARQLNVNFDVPSDLTDSVTFQILTPEGTTLNQGDKGVSLLFSDPRNLTAGLAGAGMQVQQGKRIDLKYAADERLSRGEYQFRLMSSNINIGNFRIMLK